METIEDKRAVVDAAWLVRARSNPLAEGLGLRRRP